MITMTLAVVPGCCFARHAMTAPLCCKQHVVNTLLSDSDAWMSHLRQGFGLCLGLVFVLLLLTPPAGWQVWCVESLQYSINWKKPNSDVTCVANTHMAHGKG